MEFRIQDILKNVIPGVLAVFIAIVIYSLEGNHFIGYSYSDKLKDYSEIVFFVFLVLVYIIGFTIDALASILENEVIYKLFKKPSYLLLTGNAKQKFHLPQRLVILNKLLSRCEYPLDTQLTPQITDTLFKTANWLKDQSNSDITKERIAEYYNSYIFARNISCVLFISVILNIILAVSSWSQLGLLLTIQVGTFLLVILRLKQRAYYYSRQVLIAINIPGDSPT